MNWRTEASGLVQPFGFLRNEKEAQALKAAKALSKEKKRELQEQHARDICYANQISEDEYEFKKVTDNASFEVRRFAYCKYNGIRQDAEPRVLEQHYLLHKYGEDKTKRMEYMLLGCPRGADPFKSFELKKSLYDKILVALGFKKEIDGTEQADIGSKRLFSELRGDKIDVQALGFIIGELSEHERVASFLEVKKANGDPYVWAKYALNKIGSSLGICGMCYGRRVELMSGKKGTRRWSLRGLQGAKQRDTLFRERLELVYMSCRRFVPSSVQSLFAERTKKWDSIASQV